MKMTSVQFRTLVETVVSEGVTVRFPVGAVKDWIQMAIETAGVPVSQYKYDGKNGSQVEFTGPQFSRFMSFLDDAMKSEEHCLPEEKDEIQQVLDQVMKQLPGA